MALAAPVHRDRPRNAAPLRIVRLGVWFGRAGKAPYLHLLAGLSHGLLIHSIGRLVINWESHSFIHPFISNSEAPLGSILYTHRRANRMYSDSNDFELSNSAQSSDLH